jgi:phosphate butyryltransferase
MSTDKPAISGVGSHGLIETAMPKNPPIVEDGALCKMAGCGQITGELLDGPLGFHNAIDRKEARIKGIKSGGAALFADARGRRAQTAAA